MPKPLSEVKPEDIDAQFKTIEKVATNEGSTIIGAITGVTTGSIVTKVVNDFADTQPVENRWKVKYGLKIISTLIGTGELAGTLAMKTGNTKKFAIAGGASHIATHVVDMIGEAFALKGTVLAKEQNPPVQQWQPQQQPPPQQQQPPVSQPAETDLRGT
jgi:hypothetical protein